MKTQYSKQAFPSPPPETETVKLTRIAAALSILCLSPFASATAAVTWNAVSEYPATTMPGIGLATFAEVLREQSAGEVTVTPQHDSPMGSLAAFEAVKAGTVQVADMFGGPLGTVSPMFSLPSLPFVTASIDDTKCLQAATRALYAKYFDSVGSRLLYSTPWPATGLWSSKPVKTMDDFRALNVRTYDAMSAAFVASIGVKGVNMPMGKALPLIKSGEITGVMSSGDGGAGQRLWENLPNFTALSYAAPLSFTVVNKAAFDALPKPVQDAVDKAGRTTEARLWTAIEGRQVKNYQAMKDNGVAIETSVPTAIQPELKQAASSIIADWSGRAGPDAAAVLAKYEAKRNTSEAKQDADYCAK